MHHLRYSQTNETSSAGLYFSRVSEFLLKNGKRLAKYFLKDDWPCWNWSIAWVREDFSNVGRLEMKNTTRVQTIINHHPHVYCSKIQEQSRSKDFENQKGEGEDKAPVISFYISLNSILFSLFLTNKRLFWPPLSTYVTTILLYQAKYSALKAKKQKKINCSETEVVENLAIGRCRSLPGPPAALPLTFQCTGEPPYIP